MSMRVSYKKQIFLFCLFFVIVLGGIEIIANLWWINETRCNFTNNEVFANMDDSELRKICQDQSNLNMNEFFILPNQNLNSIHINSLGFRGPEFNIEKDENTYRIFFIGGSTAFGSGSTSDQTTIPGFLEKSLNTLNTDFDIQIINAGKSGFNTLTEKDLIFETIQYMEPDLIIMYDGWNNIRADYKPEFTSSHWSEICNLGKKNGFETALFLQPTLTFGKKPLTKQEHANYLIDSDYFGYKMTGKKEIYNKYWEEMKNLSNCNIKYDLRDVFENIDAPIYYDGGHMSDYGNEIVAKSIFEVLKEDVKNSNPKKNHSNLLSAEFKNQPFENQTMIKNSENDNNVNLGGIYLQLKGLLTFYKTPIFIDSIIADSPLTQNLTKIL